MARCVSPDLRKLAIARTVEAEVTVGLGEAPPEDSPPPVLTRERDHPRQTAPAALSRAKRPRDRPDRFRRRRAVHLAAQRVAPFAERAMVGARVASCAASRSELRLHGHGRGGACLRGHRSPWMQWRALLRPARLRSAKHGRQGTERWRRCFRGTGAVQFAGQRAIASSSAGAAYGNPGGPLPVRRQPYKSGDQPSIGRLITRAVLVLESAAPPDPSGRAYAVSRARTKW